MAGLSAPEPAGTAKSNRALLLALVVLGVILRLWQWAGPGSLWLDEISLSRNIVALSLRQLVTGRLAFDQVAPPGFLAFAKLSTMAFGGSEQALWLVPLIAGLLALVLFERLAARTLRGHAVWVAVALFALGTGLIRYSAEVKQYGLDATAAVALTLIALDLRQRDRSTAQLLLAGAAGFLCIVFSAASALVMAGLGAAMAILWLIERDRRSRRALLVTIPMWAGASVIAVWMGKRSMSAATLAFMQDFWRGGFLPLPLKISSAAPWLWQRLQDLFGDPWTLHYQWAWIFALLAIVGVGVLWRERREAALMIAAPFFVTLAAAIAQSYPFRTRLVMFLVPSAIIAASAGAGFIADALSRRTSAGGLLIAAIALIPAVIALVSARVPIRVDSYRPIYADLQANRRPGDVIYVSHLSLSSAIYYGPAYGLRRGEYNVGACSRDDTRVYIRDLDRFRGKPRVWVLMRGGTAYAVAHSAMRRYLNTIGVRRHAMSTPSAVGDPVTLDLYDLSDQTRLSQASSATFPVPPMLKYPKPGCRDWTGDPRAIVESNGG